MASLILRKLDNTDVVLDDLGITLTGVAGTEYDLLSESAEHVSLSTDTVAAIQTAGTVIVLDPRDNTTPLSVANSVLAIQNHNLTHYGISGGRFSALDDPAFTPTPGQIVRIGATGEAEEVSPADVVNSTDAAEAIQDILGAALIDGTDTTVTYDDGAGTIVVNVNDSYLRNDGDVLDSGTLTVASGATIEVATGGDLTIADAPVNPTDAVNKEYVDNVAAGADVKDPVVAATTGPVSLTGDPSPVDGVTLANGDRVLVKDQADPTENGIYVFDGTDLVRAPDSDGDIDGEVSAGNQAFVSGGTTNGGATYSVSGTGNRDVGTDDINWVQTGSTTTYSNGTGIALTGTQFSLDIETLPTGTIDTTDEIAFNDTTGNNSAKTTVADFIGDLDLVTSGGVGGFATETAPGVFTNRNIVASVVDNRLGIAVENGDGTAADPTIGLNIDGLQPRAAVDATNDRVPVWDQSEGRNVYYTIGDIAGSVASTNSFGTWAASGNTTGDVSIVADSSTDTATLAGGAGININFADASDTLTFSLTSAGLTDTTSTGADTIVFFDADNADAPVSTTITDLLADNDVVTGDNFGTGTGLLIKTGDTPDTFTSREVVASTTAGAEGASVVNGDGVAGDITVGVDVNGLTDSGDDLAATDELLVFDGTNNVSMTGEQIADGVATQLNLPAISLSTINGQPVVTLPDTTRADKLLSVDSVVFTWGENALGNLDWLQIGGNATDADSGFIMPMDGTVVYASGHCENTGANSKDIHLFIDGVDQGSLGSLAGGANAEFVDNTLNLDFTQGQKLRLRAVGSGSGQVQDTVASVFVKWRA